MAEELGSAHTAKILGDASAAQGINGRTGAGKVKHLSVRQLWLQERLAAGDLSQAKVPRAVNISDCLTHHWAATEGSGHLDGMATVRCG